MKYLTRFTTQTVAAFLNRAEQQEHGYGWIRLDNYHQGAVIYDVVIPDDGQYFHHGLGIDVVVQADSMEEASDVGRAAASHIFSLVTLVTNTETGIPEEKLILDYSDGVDQRGIRQISGSVSPEVTIGTVRKLDDDSFMSVYDSLYVESVSESDRRKLSRALDRYSSSLRQLTETDQFVWMYIALDALEELLVDHFNLDATIQHECDHCGGLNEGPHHNAGKEYFLDEVGETPLSYSKLRDIRSSLFHGGPISNAHEYVMDLSQEVRHAFIEVLGLSTDDFQELYEQDINGHLREQKMIFSGHISGYEPLDISNFRSQPGVTLSLEEMDFEIVGEKIRRKPHHRFEADLPDGWGLETIALGFRNIGNSDNPEINLTDFNMEEEN